MFCWPSTQLGSFLLDLFWPIQDQIGHVQHVSLAQFRSDQRQAQDQAIGVSPFHVAKSSSQVCLALPHPRQATCLAVQQRPPSHAVWSQPRCITLLPELKPAPINPHGFSLRRAHQPAFTPAWLCCHAQPRRHNCMEPCSHVDLSSPSPTHAKASCI